MKHRPVEVRDSGKMTDFLIYVSLHQQEEFVLLLLLMSLFLRLYRGQAARQGVRGNTDGIRQYVCSGF